MHFRKSQPTVEGILTRVLKYGTYALSQYDPHDERTHPAVKRMIEKRGEKAGFYIADGALFQLCVGHGDMKGVVAYCPVRNCSRTEHERIARIFEVPLSEVNEVTFWRRSA